MKTGQTNAFFFDGAGHQILSIDIRVEKDTGDLGAMIHADMPGSNIHVSALNDNVVLTGTVSKREEFDARAGSRGTLRRRSGEGRQHAQDRGPASR